MFDDADVVVVDEADDPFGPAFARLARDVRVVRARSAQAARALTVTQEGTRVQVDPPCALLLRPLRDPGPQFDADQRFAWTEAFSTLWSAAALTARPVVNRPAEWGWSARLSPSAVVTQSRTGLPGAAPETYWHAMPPDPEFGYHQNLEDWSVADDPDGIRFGRSRALPPPRGWEQVVVVGAEAFRVSTADLGAREVEADSVRLAARLGLEFATVSWAIPYGDGPAVLARVGSFPSLRECRPVLTGVCAALVRRLTAADRAPGSGPGSSTTGNGPTGVAG